MKVYRVAHGVGGCKYFVLFQDGVKKHPDKSPFFDARLFSNKRKMEAFVRTLKNQGYRSY